MPSPPSDDAESATHFSTPMADQDGSDDPIADAINNDRDNDSLSNNAHYIGEATGDQSDSILVNAHEDAPVAQDSTSRERVHVDLKRTTRNSQTDDPIDAPLNGTATEIARATDMSPEEAKVEVRLANLLNDIRNTLQTKHSCHVALSGSITIKLAKENAPLLYRLRLVDDTESEPPQIDIHVKHISEEELASEAQHGRLATPLRKSVVDDIDASLKEPLQPRKRRRLAHTAAANGTDCVEADEEDENEDMKRKRLTDLTLGDLKSMLLDTRDEVQGDTLETVAHTHKLLAKFHGQWLANNASPSGHASPGIGRSSALRRDSATPFGKSLEVPSGSSTAPSTAFPQSADERGAESMTASSFELQRDFSQISKQIRWVEECRRMASDIHDKREEQWRISSATFHDSSRRDREKFEKWMLAEMPRQQGVMNSILNEVKGLSHLLYAMKWETPGAGVASATAPSPVYSPGPQAIPASNAHFSPPPFPSSTPSGVPGNQQNSRYPASFRAMNQTAKDFRPPGPQRQKPTQSTQQTNQSYRGQKRAAPT